MDQFIELDDLIKFNNLEFQTYNMDAEYQQLIMRKFYNRFPTKEGFYKELATYNFTLKEMVRPSFDTYFMKMAELAASRSNCMKKANGAVITFDNRVVSTGYNGTPFGIVNCMDGGC